MNSESDTPGPVLAVVNPKTALAVGAAARKQASRIGAGLQVLGVLEHPHDLRAAAAAAQIEPQALMARLSQVLREQIEAELAWDIDAPVTVRAGDKAFIEIIMQALQTNASMVIKAPEPHAGGVGRLLASTDLHLLRKCPCPVWLHAPEGEGAIRTVVAAVDVDPEAAEPDTQADVNAQVMLAALSVCEPDAEIHMLHAWRAEDAGLFWVFGDLGGGEAAAQRYIDAVKAERRRALEALADQFRPTAGGRRLIPRLVHGAPHAVIPEVVRRQRADVLVMGTVARTGLRGVIIGNTAENILNAAAGPVIAVKPSHFVSPIAPG